MNRDDHQGHNKFNNIEYCLSIFQRMLVVHVDKPDPFVYNCIHCITDKIQSQVNICEQSNNSPE